MHKWWNKECDDKCLRDSFSIRVELTLMRNNTNIKQMVANDWNYTFNTYIYLSSSARFCWTMTNETLVTIALAMSKHLARVYPSIKYKTRTYKYWWGTCNYIWEHWNYYHKFSSKKSLMNITSASSLTHKQMKVGYFIIAEVA